MIFAEISVRRSALFYAKEDIPERFQVPAESSSIPPVLCSKASWQESIEHTAEAYN